MIDDENLKCILNATTAAFRSAVDMLFFTLEKRVLGLENKYSALQTKHSELGKSLPRDVDYLKCENTVLRMELDAVKIIIH